jgi:hypothetical protein
MNRKSSYFAPLVALPVLVDQPGLYRTRVGDVVRIDEVSRAHDFGCLGSYASGIRENWHHSGRLYASVECGNDILQRVAI